jgi:hypothetical protein
MDPTNAAELPIEDRPTIPIPPPDDTTLVAEQVAGRDTQPPPAADLDEIGALYERIVNR